MHETQLIKIRKNRINFDSNSYASEKLVRLVIWKVRYLQNKGITKSTKYTWVTSKKDENHLP